MDKSELTNRMVGNLLASAGSGIDVATLWSSCLLSSPPPSATLRDDFAPAFTPPEIREQRVAFPGEESASADYVIIDRLGEGGMGVVFDAEQRYLSRRVALKMIKPEKATDHLARNSFFYEAAITAKLEHPGIIPILDFGVAEDGRAFYAMKKVTGVPWSKVIREKSREENLAILDRIIDVVAYAHGKGILHRDLKPANVMLGEFGEVWVCDWGIALARNAKGDFSHAHPGGTPQYMAPEMASCDFTRLGIASDIYLLGAILFEIMTGKPPHEGKDSLTALYSAMRNQFVLPDNASSLGVIISRAMALRPEERYATVS